MGKLRTGYEHEDIARTDADEGGRRPTEEASVRVCDDKNTIHKIIKPIEKNTEVTVKKIRRRLTVGYKLKILNEIDLCKTTADKNAIVRREGLYSSNITRWSKQRRAGELVLNNVHEQKLTKAHCQKIISDLEKENINLKNRLTQAEMIIDLQKKVSEIFGINQNMMPSEGMK